MARKNDAPTKPDSNVTLLNSACPICRKPTVLRYRPFCSKRCADIDLAKWFSGDYRVETEETPDGEEQP